MEGEGVDVEFSGYLTRSDHPKFSGQNRGPKEAQRSRPGKARSSESGGGGQTNNIIHNYWVTACDNAYFFAHVFCCS